MSWKSELDRTLHEVLRRALDDPRGDTSRALSLVNDFVALNPSRAESHFALGVVEESLLGRPTAAPPAAAQAPDADGVAPANGETSPVTLASSDGEGSLWRWLGRLDTAARSGTAERVRALAADSSMDAAVERAREGRIALRAAARALLVGGEDARAFDLYRRHLAAAPDEGSRKDADSLVGDAVRRADDLLTDPDPGATSAALGRALAFSEAVGLEGRVGAKIERKLGRAHQLSGRWADAATCYRAALARLPADDRYRAVLQGDLALAALEVRGTLDLLPTAGRAGVAEAERMLTEAQGAGDGESYNAIYTLGVLAYEREDWATAATRFREADRLMKETRAKARIVHARARFFLGACLLRQGVTGEALAEAEDLVLRDANAASLDPALKDPVLQALAVASPGARAQGRDSAPRPAEGEPAQARDGRDPRDGRGGRRERGGDRGDRGGDRGGRGGRGARPPAQDRMARYAADGPRPQGDRPRGADAPRDGGPAAPAPSTDAAAFLAVARRSLDTDPHQALKAVDDAFKSRPTFEEWYAAYRVRLEALIRLGERVEALRTYERFRAKLHERGRADRLEELLLDASGPMAEVLEEISHRAELVDLYESMPGRERAFVEASVAHAAHHAQAGTPLDLRKAVSLLREAIARGGDEAQAMWEDVAGRARAAGVPVDGPTPEEMKDRLATRAARIVLVGGDESSRGHGDRVKDIGRRAGFEGALVLGGARPHHRTLADVEEQARQGAAAIVLLHTTPQDVRDAVKKLGADLSVPVREIPYAGAASLETELLTEVGQTL